MPWDLRDALDEDRRHLHAPLGERRSKVRLDLTARLPPVGARQLEHVVAATLDRLQAGRTKGCVDDPYAPWHETR